MARTYRRDVTHGTWLSSRRIGDRDCYHEPATYRRVGDRIVPDWPTDGEPGRARLSRLAARRILRAAIRAL